MNVQMMEEVQRCIDQNRKTKDAKLDVSCRGLREIPEAIFELKHLKHLYLIGNEITYISPKIGQLTNLELLDVSGNQIESVPREIAALAHLRELHLLNNKIDTLPEDIKQLNKTLNVLALSGNRFEIIPPVVFELTQLHTLWMNYNRLKHIPAELGVNLPRLRKLAFAFNQVEEVSATLGQLAHLEVLIARCNKLRSLPAELLHCTSLHHFAIDSNRFFKRPAATASTAPRSRAIPSLLGLTSRAIINSNMAQSWCDASPLAMPEELWHLLFDQTLACATCEKQFCINELERIGFSNLNHLSCDVVHIPLVFRFCSPQCMDLAQTNGVADVKVFYTRDEVTAIAKHVI